MSRPDGLGRTRTDVKPLVGQVSPQDHVRVHQRLHVGHPWCRARRPAPRRGPPLASARRPGPGPARGPGPRLTREDDPCDPRRHAHRNGPPRRCPGQRQRPVVQPERQDVRRRGSDKTGGVGRRGQPAGAFKLFKGAVMVRGPSHRPIVLRRDLERGLSRGHQVLSPLPYGTPFHARLLTSWFPRRNAWPPRGVRPASRRCCRTSAPARPGVARASAASAPRTRTGPPRRGRPPWARCWKTWSRPPVWAPARWRRGRDGTAPAVPAGTTGASPGRRKTPPPRRPLTGTVHHRTSRLRTTGPPLAKGPDLAERTGSER